MKKELFYIFLFILCLLYGNTIRANEEEVFVNDHNSNELKSNEMLSEEKNNIYFDFGDSFTSSNNIVDIKLIDDYSIIPFITINGNIGAEILSSSYNLNEFRISLPENDGYLEINLKFENEIVTRNIYSSKRNGQYGVSSLSLYSAWGLVGNIPGQECMDNDRIDAPFVPTPEFESGREPHNRIIANGNVYGYLRW